MSTLPRPRRARRAHGSVVVVGDLMLDVVLAPGRDLEHGTDVPGRVSLHQGGSAASTARGLARLGVPTQLVCAVGRDAAGRAVVEAVRSDGVTIRVVRSPALRTGRIGVLVDPSGERSFVADRGAADALAPADLRPAWFQAAALVHLPIYSLLGRPLGLAGREAIRLARVAGAVVSLDLASIGPLLADGRERAVATVREAAPDLLFATAEELDGVLGPDGPARSGPRSGPARSGPHSGGPHSGPRLDARALDLAPIVVVKRGAAGVTVLGRQDPAGAILTFHVATRPIAAADTTGAGDAFDAGFIAEWLASRAAGRPAIVALRRAAVAGNRVAARHVAVPRRELQLG